jgi:hypothetical protein
MEFMHNYVFHLNPYTKKWAAVPRELYNEYWNDYNTKGIIKSSSISTLLEILYKTHGTDIENKLHIESE